MPKGDISIVQATKNFYKVCLKRRTEFAQETPHMLKYQPKRFWGLLRKKHTATDIDAQQFAKFNEALYYDDKLPKDTFTLPEDLATAKVTAAEIEQVLDSHFKANKSTGLSNLPTQCIKWLHKSTHPTIAAFLNKTAIE
jgi:hypothetical protein